MSSHRLWCCPFYIKNSERVGAKLTVICEAGDIKLPDSPAVKDYCGRFCSSASGWEDCPLARMLLDAEERKSKHEKS